MKSKRSKAFVEMGCCLGLVLFVFVYGSIVREQDLAIDFGNKLLSPSFMHVFGTDAYGRDMFVRTMKGLSLSLQIASVATIGSVVVSFVLAFLLASCGEVVDRCVTFLIDVFLSIPHIIFLIIISVAMGRGVRGVMVGIVATHWTYLTRILRAEIRSLKNCSFIEIALKLGKSRWYVAWNHIVPSLIPQMIVGTVMLFPHAILHEASISFLGFGLSLSTPSIGIILAESMQYLRLGAWWLAFFPGLLLVVVVVCILRFGGLLKQMVDPYRYHL